MKKLMMILVALIFMSCAEIGGDYPYTVEKGQKIIQTTWINGRLWILTRPMIKTDIAETLNFYPTEYGIFDFNQKPIKFIETK